MGMRLYCTILYDAWYSLPIIRISTCTLWDTVECACIVHETYMYMYDVCIRPHVHCTCTYMYIHVHT